ncbi:MAG: branched-chain amino acid ABC transporter permease [Cypionkella sp.]|jgi:branched-chain amino acid transport system permease protein|nr:branched-chain amino acid ABC transporter permease [Cypionkella sp.]
MTESVKVWSLHLGVLALVFAAQYVLPPYHATNLARIMVLAVFAMGYNIAFGYTGLLSLGHALFFAAGFYGMGLPIGLLDWAPVPALILGLIAGGVLAGLVGVLALRTAGVSFMIVTLMFAQAGYLTLLYLNTWTGGDEGFVVDRAARVIAGNDLSLDGTRFVAAFGLFAAAMVGCLWLVRSPFGRVMVAMRENEERSRMLGYDPFRIKLIALVLSGIYAGAAGAAYGLLFGYVGASFATIQYSILPMLYVLLGGAGTVLGPFLGAVLMFYLVDITSGYTDAYLFVVGAALVGLVLFAPRGILGNLRERFAPWLP